MFRQSRPFFETVNEQPFAGLIYFLLLGALAVVGASGWPVGSGPSVSLPQSWLALIAAVYIIRYWLLPRSRSRAWFAVWLLIGLGSGVLFRWHGLSHSTALADLARQTLLVLLSAWVMGYAGETVFGVWHQLLGHSCPWGHRFDTFAGRRAISEQALVEAGKLALSVALLGMVGLYALSLSYSFDFFAYSYVLGIAVVLVHVFTTGGVARRLKQGVVPELVRLDDSLEGVYERMQRPGAPTAELAQQFGLNLSMQEWLRGSGRIGASWESYLLLLAAAVAVLAEPYVFYVLSGLAGAK